MNFNASDRRDDIEQEGGLTFNGLSVNGIKDEASKQLVDAFLQDYGKLPQKLQSSTKTMEAQALDQEQTEKRLMALRDKAKEILQDRVDKRYVPKNRIASEENQNINVIHLVLSNIQYSTSSQDQERLAMIASLQKRLEGQNAVLEGIATQKTGRERLGFAGKQKTLLEDLQSVEAQVQWKEEQVSTQQRAKVLHYCCKKVAPDIFYAKNPLSDRIRRWILAKWPNTEYAPQDLNKLEAALTGYQQATATSPVRAARAQVIGTKLTMIIANYRKAKIRELESAKSERVAAA